METVIDGVTRVGASLLNGYKGAIEDCQQVLPTTEQFEALGGRPGEDSPGGYNPYVCMRDRRVFEDAVRFRDDFIGSRSDAWQVTVTGAGTCTQTSMRGGVVSLETGATTGNRVVLSFGGSRFLEWGEPWRPYVRILVALQDPTAQASVGLYADEDNLIEITHGGVPGQTWQARCRASGVETTVNTGVDVTDAPLWLTLISSPDVGSVDFYLDNGIGLPHERDPEATISDNIPTAALEPRIRVETTADAAARLDVDLVHIQANR